jgi:hypothetical protein
MISLGGDLPMEFYRFGAVRLDYCLETSFLAYVDICNVKRIAVVVVIGIRIPCSIPASFSAFGEFKLRVQRLAVVGGISESAMWNLCFVR